MAEQVSAVISPEQSIAEQVRPVRCTGPEEEEEEKVMAEQVSAVISPERSIDEHVRPVRCTGRGGEGGGHG